MTMSQIPDVNRELAEVGAVFSAFRVAKYTKKHPSAIGVSPNPTKDQIQHCLRHRSN